MKDYSDNNKLVIEVNVTKIVKYVCLAGVLIVGIVFGTNCFEKIVDNSVE